MGICWGCAAMIVAAAVLSGCEEAEFQRSGGPTVLTETQMDRVSAGTAAAVSSVQAFAVGAAPQTSASTSTLANAGTPMTAQPFLQQSSLNYASVQGTASAANGSLTDANGSTQIGVNGGGGGASIEAATVSMAAGSTSSQTQINMQFYGVSIGHVDLVFGTATAAACCAPTLEAQVTAEGSGGGYLREYKASPITDNPGQVQSRVDISIISSALPILDTGQASVLVGPTLSQISNQ
jgi:hypothetical protein